MLQGGTTNGMKFKKEASQIELDKVKVQLSPVHFVSLWVKKLVNVIKGEDEIKLQKSIVHGSNEGSVDWKKVKKPQPSTRV